jgi:Na+(H+)/acetate symporter ActP
MIISKIIILSIFISLLLLKLKANVVLHAFSIFFSAILFGILFIVSSEAKNMDTIIFFSLITVIIGLINAVIILLVSKKIKTERSKHYLNQTDVMTGNYD